MYCCRSSEVVLNEKPVAKLVGRPVLRVKSLPFSWRDKRNLLSNMGTNAKLHKQEPAPNFLENTGQSFVLELKVSWIRI